MSGDIYNDRMRHDNFQARQDDIQNSIQASADNYTSELNESKIADIQNKTIGSELMFSSIPATFSKGIETFDRVKGLYKKIQALPEKVSGIVDDAKTQAGGLLEDAKGQAGGLLEDAKGQAGGLLEDAKGQAGGLLEDAKGQAGDLVQGKDIAVTPSVREVQFDNPLYEGEGEGIAVKPSVREVQFDNPLYEGEGIAKPAITAETFGNVRNYLGGQVGDLGGKVSVLPNMETSVGSLKQAIPKPVAIDDALSGGKAVISDTISGAGDVVSDISGRATDAVSNLASGAGDAIGDVAGKAGDAVSDIAGKAGDIASGLVSGGTDIAETAASALAEAAVPIVGDVLAVGSLVAGAYEGIKDLVDKPSAPAPPTINLAPGGVNQAGI